MSSRSLGGSGVRAVALVALGAVLVALGCGRAGTAGLSNAPGGTRPWTEQDRSQDAIANGRGSCPEPGKPDPLPNRQPACVEASARPAASAPPPPR